MKKITSHNILYINKFMKNYFLNIMPIVKNNLLNNKFFFIDFIFFVSYLWVTFEDKFFSFLSNLLLFEAFLFSKFDAYIAVIFEITQRDFILSKLYLIFKKCILVFLYFLLDCTCWIFFYYVAFWLQLYVLFVYVFSVYFFYLLISLLYLICWLLFRSFVEFPLFFFSKVFSFFGFASFLGLYKSIQQFRFRLDFSFRGVVPRFSVLWWYNRFSFIGFFIFWFFFYMAYPVFLSFIYEYLFFDVLAFTIVQDILNVPLNSWVVGIFLYLIKLLAYYFCNGIFFF